MEKQLNILDEIKAISPLLAGIDKVNVYDVPAGYFESIAATLLASVNIEPVMPGIVNEPTVPTGYFDGLADSILNKIKNTLPVEEEIASLSPTISAISKTNVFEVPNGYFNQLNDVILSRLSVKKEIQELSPLLADLQGINVFEVPALYFEKSISRLLSQQVTILENNDGSEQLSPLLSNLKQRHVFEVPQGYFELLPAILLNLARSAPAKVISIRNRIIKLAAAAVITGAIAFGITKYTSNTSVAKPDNTTFASVDAAIEKGTKMNDQQFEEAFEKLNEADISQYLEKHGDITDMATLRNNLDETVMPTQDDYLLDEKALENYLNKIETTTLKN